MGNRAPDRIGHRDSGARPGPRAGSLSLGRTGAEDHLHGLGGCIHTRLRSADLNGNAIQLSADAEPFATINGGLAAFTRHHRRNTFASDVMIEDATTGERVSMVEDARYPLIFDGGTALLFLPDNAGRLAPGDRDEFVHSVWYRDLVSGQELRLADLHDLDPTCRSSTSRRLRTRNRWRSPTATTRSCSNGTSGSRTWNGTGLRQLTTDDRSLYPSFSADGRTIAFTHLNPNRRCSGSVHLMDADGSNARRLAAGTCEAILLRPI